MYKIIKVVKFLKLSWTFLVSVSLVVLLCAGCKLDYKDADLVEEMNEQVPNSVLDNFSQVVVRDGKVSYTFSADHAELFDSSKLTYFDNIGFTEYKADGSTGTEGAAVRAIHDSKTDNIIFDGKLILNATAQDFDKVCNNVTLKDSYIVCFQTVENFASNRHDTLEFCITTELDAS